MRLFAVVCLIAAVAIPLPRLDAQGTTAAILGTVTDSSGAAIAGASVKVTNTGTGLVQNTLTDAVGRYNVPDLTVGEYEVRAAHEGFTTVLHRGITLTVGSQNVVDFVLAVGQAQQTVTVQGDITQVETTNSTVGALVDQIQLRELPLNGRDVESLLQLAPGVQNYYAGSNAIGTGTGANMREGRDRKAPQPQTYRSRILPSREAQSRSAVEECPRFRASVSDMRTNSIELLT